MNSARSADCKPPRGDGAHAYTDKGNDGQPRGVNRMALTMWINDFTGQRLNEAELREVRSRAHRAYQANGHLFEDEADALVAFGVVSMLAV